MKNIIFAIVIVVTGSCHSFGDEINQLVDGIRITLRNPEDIRTLLKAKTIVKTVEEVDAPANTIPGVVYRDNQPEVRNAKFAQNGIIYTYKVEILKGTVNDMEKFKCFDLRVRDPQREITVSVDKILFLSGGNEENLSDGFHGEVLNEIMPGELLKIGSIDDELTIIQEICENTNISDLVLCDYVIRGKDLASSFALNELLKRNETILPDLAVAFLHGKSDYMKKLLLIMLLKDNELSDEQWLVFAQKLKLESGFDLPKFCADTIVESKRFLNNDSSARFQKIFRK